MAKMDYKIRTWCKNHDIQSGVILHVQIKRKCLVKDPGTLWLMALNLANEAINNVAMPTVVYAANRDWTKEVCEILDLNQVDYTTTNILPRNGKKGASIVVHELPNIIPFDARTWDILS
jgi:hypothetical protein